MKIIGAKEYVLETCHVLHLENEGQIYRCELTLSDYGTDENWFNSNNERILSPDFADDLDLFELHEQAMKDQAAAI